MVLTLALALGATTAIFTLVHGVVLNPLPYPQSDRLVWLGQTAPGINFPMLGLSPGLYGAYAEQAQTLEATGFYRSRALTLTGSGDPARMTAAEVNAELLQLLGVQPLHGRLLTAADDRVDSERVVLLAEGLWRERFGGSRAVIGDSMVLDGQSFAIAGVLPDGFDFPAPGTQLWLDSEVVTDIDGFGRFGGFDGVGRLRDGVDLEGLRVDLDAAIAALLERTETAERQMLEGAQLAAAPVPLQTRVIGSVAQTLWVLFAAVGFVFLIALVNVANLVAVRAQTRRRETALRLALGASRAQLARLFLAESLLVSATGAVLGLLLATFAVRYLVATAPPGLPRLPEVGVDLTVVLFLALLLAAATLLFGLLPLARSFRARTNDLRDGGRGPVAGLARRTARRVLLAAQVALALILLVGSGLMARSFWELRNVDPGVEINSVLRVSLSLPESRYPGTPEAMVFHDELLARLSGLPGVTSVAAASTAPLEGVTGGVFLYEEGVPEPADGMPTVINWIRASTGLPETVELPLVAGRGFAVTDRSRATAPVLINRALADLYWPGEPALGRRVRTNRSSAEEPIWHEVVGVVENYAFQLTATGPAQPLVIFPLVGGDPTTPRTLTYLVRTERDPVLLADAVRATVWEMDSIPLMGMRSMREVADSAAAPMAFTMMLLWIASAMALGLGCVGVYGVFGQVVRERAAEIGVRLALGAQRSSVLAMLLRQGLAVGILGVIGGLAGSWALVGSMQSLLFQVSPLDPLVHAAVAMALLLVVGLATYLPARRAARLDPAATLRAE